MATFERLNQIGSGGFGTVWKCRRQEDGQIFAEKILGDGADEDAVKRFNREVRITSQLNHPNIIRIIGRRLSSPPYFYVMPLYQRSLRQEFPSISGDQERIRTIFTSLLDGLENAHNEGVIHRDLKPENILLNSDDDIVISDFGLGRHFDADSTRQTLTGFGMGTPLYMAPEQFQNAKDATEVSDIYSCGRILLELFLGEIGIAPPDYSELPPEISVIVRRCCEYNPAKRFQSVGELKIAYESIYDAQVLTEQLGALEAVITKLSAVQDATTEDAQALIDGLLPRLSDDDLIQNTTMSVTPEVFPQIEKISTDSLRAIIKRFSDVITSQGWPFGYTDRIGNRCRDIYIAISDFEARSDLLYAIVEVGASHNRWHVMSIAGTLLSQPKKPGEALPIVERLSKIPHYVESISKYVNRTNLDPHLKALIPEEK